MRNLFEYEHYLRNKDSNKLIKKKQNPTIKIFKEVNRIFFFLTTLAFSRQRSKTFLKKKQFEKNARVRLRVFAMTVPNQDSNLLYTGEDRIVTSAPHYHIHSCTGDNNIEAHHLGRLFLKI